jgi:hypothetical protein
MLVTHGDELDYAVRYSRLNRFIGDIAYELLMWVNRRVNQLREAMGKPYWSLAKWVKVNVSQAEAAIRAYQHAAVNLVRDRGWTASSAGTCTTRPWSSSTTCCTATTATGWKTVRRSSRTSAASCAC